MIEWNILLRQWFFGILVAGAGFLYGQYKDIDEDELRPYIKWLRNSTVPKILLMSLIIAGGGLSLDFYIYQVLIPRFETGVLVGIGTVVLSLIFAGAGFPLGKYMTERDYQPVENP